MIKKVKITSFGISRNDIEIPRDVIIRDGVMLTDAKKTNTYNIWLLNENEIQAQTLRLPIGT